MLSAERKEFLVSQLIRVHNNYTLPQNIKREALEIEIAVHAGRPPEEIESRYIEFQVKLVDSLLGRTLSIS